MYCAFVDLVGMQELAITNDSAAYHRATKEFIGKLAEICIGASSAEIRVHVFSDSAFIEAKELPYLLKFAGMIRRYMFARGVFFKGAIVKGSLEAQPAASERDTAKHAHLRDVLFGHTFGPGAAGAYLAQVGLKGIGIAISGEVALEAPDGTVVDSCFIPTERSRRAQPFVDVSLDKTDRRSTSIQPFIEGMFRAKSMSRAVGRYYIPHLVSWVRSMAIEELQQEGDPSTDLVTMVLSGFFDKSFSDVPGFECVFLAILGRIVAEHISQSKSGSNSAISAGILTAVKRMYAASKRHQRWITVVPTSIVPIEARNYVVAQITADVIQATQAVGTVIKAIRDAAPLGRSADEIAAELNEASVLLENQRTLWSGRSVQAFCRPRGLEVPPRRTVQVPK